MSFGLNFTPAAYRRTDFRFPVQDSVCFCLLPHKYVHTVCVWPMWCAVISILARPRPRQQLMARDRKTTRIFEKETHKTLTGPNSWPPSRGVAASTSGVELPSEGQCNGTCRRSPSRLSTCRAHYLSTQGHHRAVSLSVHFLFMRERLASSLSVIVWRRFWDVSSPLSIASNPLSICLILYRIL
jgi:hypothetical protein